MNERVTYLRNLVIALRSDGRVGASEREILNRIASEIQASMAEMQAALNTLGQHTPSWEGSERFSTKVRNLEDMAEICLSDGELSVDEKRLLAQAALSIGLSQSQTNDILHQVARRLGMA